MLCNTYFLIEKKRLWKLIVLCLLFAGVEILVGLSLWNEELKCTLDQLKSARDFNTLVARVALTDKLDHHIWLTTFVETKIGSNVPYTCKSLTQNSIL